MTSSILIQSDRPRRVYGRKYRLIFDQNTECWQVLEWTRNASPMAHGMSILTFTNDGILAKLFDESD